MPDKINVNMPCSTLAETCTQILNWDLSILSIKTDCRRNMLVLARPDTHLGLSCSLRSVALITTTASCH